MVSSSPDVLLTKAPGEPIRPEHRKIKVYDFRRPDKFSKEQTLVLARMHETFARLVTTTLSAHLRTVAHVRLISVDQLTYEEFLRSIPSPTTLSRIDMDPLRGQAVLEIDPAVAFAIVCRSFGGERADPALNRELTPIETSLMEYVIARNLGSLREAWSPVIDLRPRLGGIECNPQFAQVVPPTEMVVLVTLETTIGDATGMMNLCIPYLTLHDIVPRLTARHYYALQVRRAATPPSAMRDLSVEVDISYEGGSVTLGSLTRLRKGDLVPLPGYSGGHALLRAGGVGVSRLEAARSRARRREVYVLVDRAGETVLRALTGRRQKAEVESRSDELQAVVRSFTADIGGVIRSLEAKVADVARRQGELSDQLAFPSAESEASAAGPSRPFRFLTITACEPLALLLAGEHPQLIALVLSYLDPAVAACVLGKLGAPTQADVASRIRAMRQVLPEVLRDVERVLERGMAAVQSADYIPAGGLDAVVEILGVADRTTERNVLASLGATESGLAEEIKRRLFVFEDIVLLTEEDARRVLGGVAEEDLVLALKAVEEPLRARILAALPGERAEALAQAVSVLGRIRLRDAEAAQQRIVGIIRKLGEEGTILITRIGDKTIVD